MRRFTLEEFVKRGNPPARDLRTWTGLKCGCGLTPPDEFGNRDLEPVPDCPWHGEGA